MKRRVVVTEIGYTDHSDFEVMIGRKSLSEDAESHPASGEETIPRIQWILFLQESRNRTVDRDRVTCGS